MRTYHDSRQAIESVAGGAPTAFRIWHYGPNDTDHGPVVFNETSAKLLMESQEKRGNLYSIDYDHLSLAKDRPATAGQASGWHTIEVRDGDGGPELWAANVEWCAEAQDGIEAKPPKWRYISPAYATDEEGVIVDYINLALCVNPATHRVTALATRSLKDNKSMDNTALLAMLKAFLGMEGLPEEAKAKVAEMIAAMEKSEGPEAEQDAEGEEDPAMKKDEVKEEPKVPYESKKDSIDLAGKYAALESKLAKMELEKLFADNVGKKITPGLKSWFMGLDMDTAQSYLKSAPALDTSVKTIKRADTVGDIKYEGKAEQTEDEAHIDRVMGFVKSSGKVGMDSNLDNRGRYVIHTATPAEIKARKNQK